MNISDVAKAAGVSNATVSRVLSNSDYPVRGETRERVLRAIEELGFRPNDLARGLLLKKTRTVGLVIPDISNPYYPGISRGVERVAASAGYTVTFGNTDRRPEKAKAYVDALLQKRVDGIIIAGGSPGWKVSPETFEPLGTKVVLIGRHDAPLPSAQVDNVAAARQATDHLVSLGHRCIAFVSGPVELTSGADRLEGYCQSLEAHGVGFDPSLVRQGDYEEAGGYEAAKQLLALRPAPTAIFAANDRMAIGAMAAANDSGVQVPQDLAIVGFDDISMASYLRPSLTTVSLPTHEMGATAMELLLKQMADEPVPHTVWLEARLIVRQSCGAAPWTGLAGSTASNRRP